jgi:sensor histidine kinase YesM
MIKRLRAKSNRWIELTLHVAGWALFLLLPYLLRSSRANAPRPPKRLRPPEHLGPDIEQLNRIHYEPLIFNLLMIPLFYINVVYLVPKFILKRKYLSFLAIQIGIVVCLNFIGDWLHSLLAPGIPSMKMGLPIFLYLLLTSFAVCYCLVKQNIEHEQKQKEKENENLKSELQFLRWQISPHFMFNALNNMVALSRVKSDKLEPMLMRLSTLMRYMLYDTDEKRLPIRKEIEYLQSYIDLQTIRFGSDLNMISNIDIEDNVDVTIEPMLLIPFVENAFKHGAGIVDKPLIHMSMRITNDKLSFSIRNRFVPGVKEDDEQGHGIGLANVRRRLNLLYGDHFSLDTSEIEDLFLVNLIIHFR